MKNENGIKINVNIDNVERIAIVDDAILIIATDNTNYKLYYNKLTDLKDINNFKEYDTVIVLSDTKKTDLRAIQALASVLTCKQLIYTQGEGYVWKLSKG